MRLFFNAFLILFAADGLMSVADELLPLMSIESNLTGLRGLIANNVILMSLPCYLLLGIDSRPPKQVFLPLIAFVVASLLLPWFFPSLSESAVYAPLFSLLQLLLCLVPLEFARRNGGEGLLLPAEMFRQPFFDLPKSLRYAALSIVLVPLVTLLCGLAIFSAYAEEATAGFVRISPTGLYMAEKTYRRGGQTIRLAGMIHIGDRRFYDEMAGSLATPETVVLAEGVTDEKGLLQNRFGYGRMAGFLGLSSQETMRFRGRLIKELPKEKAASVAAGTGVADVLRADLDTAAFDKVTIRFLDVVGSHIRQSSSFVGAMLALNTWAEKELTPEMQKTIVDDILHKRSKALIQHIDPALSGYDNLMVPWGALHMPEIEEAVIQRGFELQEKQLRNSVSFRKMLFFRAGMAGNENKPQQ